MSDRTTTVTRRRLLGGLVTIGGAGLAVGAGTVAAFADSESSGGNTVQSGTIDLAVDGSSDPVTFLAATEIAPGESGSRSITLGNDGTVDGTLEIDVVALRDEENDVVIGENRGDSQDITPNDGELPEYVDLRVEIDGTEVVGWTGLDAVQSRSMPFTYSTGVSIDGNSTRELTVFWRFLDPGDDAVNETQSDRVELDLTFRLVQE